MGCSRIEAQKGRRKTKQRDRCKARALLVLEVGGFYRKMDLGVMGLGQGAVSSQSNWRLLRVSPRSQNPISQHNRLLSRSRKQVRDTVLSCYFSINLKDHCSLEKH